MYEFNYLYITTILLKGSLLLKSTMINLRWLLTLKLGTLVGGHQKKLERQTPWTLNRPYSSHSDYPFNKNFEVLGGGY